MEGGLHLTSEQLRFIQLLVARNYSATSARIKDLGRGRLLITMFDKVGQEAGRHELGPDNLELP